MKRLSTFLLALLLTWIGASAQSTGTITLQNPSFEEDDINTLTVDGTRASTTSSTGAYTLTEAPTGWTLTNTPNVCDIMTADAAATDNDFGAPGAPSNGEKMLYLRDSYANGTTDINTTLMQKVKLSAGTYKVTVDSKCIHNGATNPSTAKLVAGGEHAELPYHSGFVPANWDETSVTFMVDVEDTEVEIGVEIYFANSQNQGGFSVLLDNFTIAEATDVELTAHYEEAEFSHWSISGNSGGSFQYNTWSTEVDTESGMAIPFIEYWVGAGSVLSDATIKHQQLQGLPEGDYIVSIFARAFNEANGADADEVKSGITFTANDQSVDLTTGTEGIFIKDTSTGYQSTEVYGVYELNCTVGSDGTLDIGFTVASETACDWMAFKDLKVVMDTQNYPTLTAPTGEMDPDVQAAMEAALATYAADPTGDNFFAAIEAIQDAYASIAAYAADLKGGDYLIMTSDGYYLGGGLVYGTQASIIGKPQFINLEVQTNGTFHLDSHQYNSATNHYLGANLYFDNGTPVDWTIEAVEGGYTIYGTVDDGKTGYLTSNGFQTEAYISSTPYVWTFLTMDDVVASMSEASATNPVDVTALIQAPELKRNSNTEWYPTWTVTGYSDTTNAPSNYAFGGGSAVANCAESWHSNNGFNFSQDITLPLAGYYTLSAQGFYTPYEAENAPVMYVDDQTVEFPVLNNADITTMAGAYSEFLDGKHPVGPIAITTAEANETVTIGFKGVGTSTLWNIMGELELLYYAEGPAHECFVDIDDWKSDGTTVAFNDWSVETDASGMRDPFLQVWVYSQDATQSTLEAQTISHNQLTGLTPGVYEVSMDIRIFSEAGNTIGAGTTFNANGVSEDIATGGDHNDGTYNSTEKEVYGTYTLTCVVDGNGTLDISIEIPDGVSYNWVSWKNLKVLYMGDLYVDWNMTAAEWGTLILPFAASVPEELTAYTIASVDEDDEDEGIVATLSLTASNSIVANTPYIMGVAEGAENYVKPYTFTGTPTNTANSYTGTTVEGASLTGTFVDMSLANGDFTADGNEYVLQMHDGDAEPAFYPIVSGSSSGVTLDAYHCYLTYSSPNGVRASISFPGSDDEATAIVAVESEEAEADGAIYDLSGRRVSKAVKGVYIQNGKKVLVK